MSWKLFFSMMSGFFVELLCDRYEDILEELGVDTGDQYQVTVLKQKEHYGSHISVFDQTKVQDLYVIPQYHLVTH